MPARILPILAACSIAFFAAAVHADQAVSIGSRLELFVDEFLIEHMEGVELKLNRPEVRENVFRFDRPWEGAKSTYVTLFKDGDRYRMYYRGSRGGELEVTCAAESPNGVHWARPVVGLHEYEGSKNNNIVWTGQGSQNFAPFMDANPDAKAEARYKAVAEQRVGGVPKGRKGLFAFASRDGYTWTKLLEDPIIVDGAFDSHNLAFWDGERHQYVCYLRDRRNGYRSIKRATSKDFIKWSKPEWLEFAGAPEEHLYTNAIVPYYRAPHICLGFPKRFVPERKAIKTHPLQGISDGLFMSSRDGLHFHRWEEAFMRPGLAPENWTDRSNMAAWGILELQPGEISMYYTQGYGHPTNHLVRATLRTDGFVSACAGAKGGEILTKPLVFGGRELVINYSTSAAGEVQVEIQDDKAHPIPGFRMEECPVIYGDEIERVVTWDSGGDVSALPGKPVRLRFRLKDADLYSFRFRE